MGEFELWVTFDLWLTFELWVTFDFTIKYELWVNFGGGDEHTDMHTDTHTDTHINTMTRPSKGAGPNENTSPGLSPECLANTSSLII